MRAWGISGWSVNFYHGCDVAGNVAEVSHIDSIKNRSIKVGFTRDASLLKHCSIKIAAKHECAHLLVARLHHLGTCRECTYMELDEEYEHLAVTLERLLPD